MITARPGMRGKGFTLLELMVTVLVASVLMALAVPSYRTMVQQHRVRATTDNVQAAIQYARTEAVLRASYVSYCASADGATCSGTATYETGWLVYAHAVGSTKASDTFSSSSSAMVLLRASANPTTTVSVRGLDAKVVTFGQQGQLEAVSSRTNASQPMSFVVCTAPKGGLGTNTSRIPGSRIGITPYGGIVATKLNTTDTCTPAS